MTTMSDDGDRTCPLCAEEMDLTDQQLKPCKCGYEICVWCWHHIMDMAEKDDTEGRCPACRTTYDKERIIKMAANCERMVAEINADKKHKSQKAKPKTSLEARKHLTSVRVIQRNLAYIVGLPMNICDENILERREYFGQYGKVLKVSISRPSGPASQQVSANNTFSVYITYGKEEEAIRCIQAVHNFVLEGKTLRACFGTTKYCHAWLRNMSCNNPDCLFLHEVGKQEDSFTKDEIISEYTRSRVPQIGLNSLQRRSGNILPPVADEFPISGTVSSKQGQKNSSTSQTKVSPPNSSAGRSTLPAAASWGLRNVTSRPAPSVVALPQASSKSKNEANNPQILSSCTNTKSMHVSAWNDDVCTASKAGTEGNISAAKPCQPDILKDSQMIPGEAFLDMEMISIPSAWNDDEVVPSVVASKACDDGRSSHKNGCTVGLENAKSSSDKAQHIAKSSLLPGDELSFPFKNNSSSCSNVVTIEFADRDASFRSTADDLKRTSLGVLDMKLHSVVLDNMKNSEIVDQNIDKLSSDLSSLCLDRIGNHSVVKNSDNSAISISSTGSSNQNTGSEFCSNHADYLLSHSASKNDAMFEQKKFFGGSQPLGNSITNSVENAKSNLLATDNQYYGLSGTATQLPSSIYLNSNCPSNFSTYDFWKEASCNDYHNRNPEYMPSLANGSATSLNGHSVNNSRAVCRPTKVLEHPGIKEAVDGKVAKHHEENSIISDILSLEYDPWDDSSLSSNNFVKMLEETDIHDAQYKLPASWKAKSSRESRFSFARQDAEASYVEPSQQDNSKVQTFSWSSQNYYGGSLNGLDSQYVGGLNEVVKCSTISISDQPIGVDMSLCAPPTSGAPRKTSAPPGFSAPNRVPPPGFSHGRSNQINDPIYAENHLSDNLLNSNPHQGNQMLVNQNSGGIEFFDPAILAVGEGRLPRANAAELDMKPPSSFEAQFSKPYSDPRIHMLMQQAMSSQQNFRMPSSVGEPCLPINENYIASQFLVQNRGSLSPLTHMPVQQPTNSMLTNSQWDSWGDVQAGNTMALTDIFRNERFGVNSFYSTNDENGFHIPSSKDLYNRAFGM